jgi:hypothetical protein
MNQKERRTDRSCDCAGKQVGQCRPSVRFHSGQLKFCRFTERSPRKPSTSQTQRVFLFATAMGNMEITEEQIFQEKQRLEEEEIFQGKVSTYYS